SADLDSIEPIDEAESRVEVHAPVLVALSVALVAQLGRRFARWWMTRDRSRMPRATRQLDRASVSRELELAHQVDALFEESDHDADLLPIAGASSTTRLGLVRRGQRAMKRPLLVGGRAASVDRRSPIQICQATFPRSGRDGAAVSPVFDRSDRGPSDQHP